MKKEIIYLATILLSIFILSSCGNELPYVNSFGNDHFNLVNQNGEQVSFPDDFKGNTVVMGFIYTNCPDICPLTTNNMKRIKEKLVNEGIRGVKYISLSFDPEHDTPMALKKYAEVRKIDLSNWTFLTGKKPVIDSLIHEANVFAAPSDTSVTPSGDKTVFFVHTDRISLLDSDMKIRKNYQGSKINVAEIVNDIKTLED